MKYCKNCNVYISNLDEKCCLCNEIVIETKVQSNMQVYPKYYEWPKNKNIFQTILLLISIIVSLISLIINIIFYEELQYLWSILICFGSFILWLTSRLVIFSQRNLSIRLLAANTILFWFLLSLDLLLMPSTYGYWNLTYLVPFTSILFLLVTLTIVLTKAGTYPDYFGNMVLHITFMILPIVLYICTENVILSVIPAIISSTIALIIIIGMFVLPSKGTKEEIKKRLHI